MNSRKIRVGSVGLGCISTGVHLPGIEKSADLILAALCDTDPAALRAAQEKYHIDDAHCFADYHDLIRCADVDAVDISTPNDCHFEIAMAAVEVGKPYVLEKPVTMTAEEADRLAKLTREKNIKNMVCFSYRFKAAARFARSLIEEGRIGEIYHVNMQYLQSWGIPEADTPLVWRFVRSRTGSGALGDLGSHALDLVRFVTGKEYTRIVGHADTLVAERKLLSGDGSGKVDVDDFCNYMADMEGGVSASFQITRFAYGRGNYQRMEIYGSKGAIVYSLDVKPNVDEIEVCIGPVYNASHQFITLPVPEKFLSDQMQSFADICNGKGDGMPATIFDGQKNQHVVDAIIESYEKSKWIDLL